MRGIKIDTVDDYGAYIQFGVGHHGNALAQVIGPYTMTSVQYRVRAALTNKNQQGAYRGFGSEVNNWMLEQMVDKAAASSASTRSRSAGGTSSAEFRLHPDRQRLRLRRLRSRARQSLELAEYDHWRDEQAAARAEGRYIGIGVITAQERSVFSPPSSGSGSTSRARR